MKYFLATLIIAITLPLVAQAEVRINEIAWMGVTGTGGQYGEWFELYNDGAEPVSLTGWVLYKDGGAKSLIVLSQSIPADGYLLVERTTPSMTDPVPGIQDISGTFSNGGLANTGEYLVLKTADGSVVEELNFAAGWPIADSSTKDTMQWTGSVWVAAPGTPKAQNANAPSTPVIDEEIVKEETVAVTEVEKTTEAVEESTQTNTSHKSSKDKTIKSLSLIYPKNDPRINFIVPGAVYQGVLYEYEGTVILEKSEPKYGNFVWNMGDGTVLKTDTLSSIRHSYQYPGIYTVTLAYHSAPAYIRPIIQASAVVEVMMPTITLTALNSGTLQIKNTANTSIDMSGWLLYTPEGYAELPLFTILAPKGNMALPIDRIGLRVLTTATLKTKEGNTMAVLGISEDRTQVVKRRSTTPAPLSFMSYAAAAEPFVEHTTEETAVLTPQTEQHRTKTIVIGAVVAIGIALLLFLERFIARQE